MKKITLATLIGLVLTGCGGGGGDDSTAPQPPVETKPRAVQGTINAVNVPANTIEVNGYSYNVGRVEYGDQTLSIRNLAENMTVEVSTTTKSGAVVYIEPTMVGKITAISPDRSTFIVNGVTLNFSLDKNIEPNNWVMVSSLPQATSEGFGYKVLSVVKFEEGDIAGQYEIEGRLSSLNENDKTFTLGAATQVRYTDNIIEDNKKLSDGLWVEVKGQMNDDNTFDATEVEVETYDASDNDNEIEGIVTWVNRDKSQFELNARGRFMVTSSTYFEDGTKANLNIGVMVEVTAVNGIAREIEFENDFDGDFGDTWREFEYTGQPSIVSQNNTFTIKDKVVHIDAYTEFDDGLNKDNISYHKIDVEGVIIGTRYVAREIEREDD
ncbi:DUF5666 domain-containing protein [Photobacterium phosphoreum]|uniref:DUF5666 domain-containing protein n=1 Tax=Photobacterium phosphoreum TaxID=659 RepID=UPI001E516DC6|nr:DUF5666 domain-containing protein [Photobacterium phosphoreum]MCD9473547.1 hypothetical protein [Photobacterium phosphoreum]MCF2175102.1 hypothetical protein [Photobacterium phosphoreum]